jgi:hypothetical protein
MKMPRALKCECRFCKNEKDFDPQRHLLEKFEKNEVVLFVGAGISTENLSYCQTTFYEEIRGQLTLPDTPSFPELMTKYCALPDGRIKLLQKIKRQLDYLRHTRRYSKCL